jgi:hypothetical protein
MKAIHESALAIASALQQKCASVHGEVLGLRGQLLKVFWPVVCAVSVAVVNHFTIAQGIVRIGLVPYESGSQFVSDEPAAQILIEPSALEVGAEPSKGRALFGPNSGRHTSWRFVGATTTAIDRWIVGGNNASELCSTGGAGNGDAHDTV